LTSGRRNNRPLRTDFAGAHKEKTQNPDHGVYCFRFHRP
jgi:hypothetical protein